MVKGTTGSVAQTPYRVGGRAWEFLAEIITGISPNKRNQFFFNKKRTGLCYVLRRFCHI